MTDKEAEAVFATGASGERLCARLYRRPDGTVMTDNCPRALRRIRNASRWLKTKIVACFGLLLSMMAPAQAETPDKNKSKSGAPTSKSAPIDAPQIKDKSSKDKSAPDKTTKDHNKLMPTMGAIRVPTPAEKAELGKVAAPSTVTPNKVAPSADRPQDKKAGGVPIPHKMGRIRVEPAATPATEEAPAAAAPEVRLVHSLNSKLRPICAAPHRSLNFGEAG